MKRYFQYTFLFFALILVYSANAQYSVKIDPFLRLQKNEFKAAEHKKESPSLLANKFKPLTSIEVINNKPFSNAFIKTSDPEQTKASLLELGATVSTVTGNIIVCKVPLFELDKIATFPEVIKIEGSTKRKPLLDKSRADIKADMVHSGTGITKALKGKGVVVGIVDSGIDFNHDDFDDANGTTRIKYIWDVSDNGNPPQGLGYGHEYNSTQINSGNCIEKDGNGHGTHVSGTAAGSGRASSAYIGIAPESDIIFVKGMRDPDSQSGFEDVDVVNGCAYIFQKAMAMGKPAVINLSLGGHLGAHDGASLYEEALSSMTSNGRIIVAAAGNQGDGDAYSGWPHVGYNANSIIQYTIMLVQDPPAEQLIDLWFSSGGMEVGIAAVAADGTVLGAVSCSVNGDSAIKTITYNDGTNTYNLADVSIWTTDFDEKHNAKEAVIYMKNTQTYGGLVTWVLATQAMNSQKFDAWFVQGGTFSDLDNSQYAVVKGDNVSTIGIPGTSKKLICVGSHVSKDNYTDVTGTSHDQGTLNAISTFSSRGPTRDSRMKPDITAPGEVIVAAKSSQASVPLDEIILGTNNKLQKMQGTSMASPHVTGLVALMLQANPNLNYEQVLSILKQTSRKDSYVGNVPNNTWGSGKVNALEACKEALTLSGIEDDDFSTASTKISKLYPIPVKESVSLEINLPEDSFVTIKILDIFGNVIYSIGKQFLSAGQHYYDWSTKSFTGEKLPAGVYFYKISYDLNSNHFIETQKFTVAE